MPRRAGSCSAITACSGTTAAIPTRQEALFFGLLRDCLEAGAVSEAFLREEMGRGHLRPDALEQIPAAPTVEAVLGEVEARRAA